MTKIAVLGAGSWGTALANTAAENGHDVRLWTHNPDQVEEINQQHTNVKYLPHATLVDTLVATSDMFLAIENVEIVLSVVPTKAVREVAKKLATALEEQAHTVI